MEELRKERLVGVAMGYGVGAMVATLILMSNPGKEKMILTASGLVILFGLYTKYGK